MMFVGTEGNILASFNVQNPVIISGKNAGTSAGKKTGDDNQVNETTKALPLFADAVKSGKQYPGNFSEADHLTEAINLYAVALRSNTALHYDGATQTISNSATANDYLKRAYRPGWDPDMI